jgi:hypothetical protein
MTPKALFPSGDITYSRACRVALRQANVSALRLLCRHLIGDWGAISAQQRQANQAALNGNSPVDDVISRYPLPDEVEVVVVTRYIREPRLRWTDIGLAEEMGADRPADDEDGPPDEEVYAAESFEEEMRREFELEDHIVLPVETGASKVLAEMEVY